MEQIYKLIHLGTYLYYLEIELGVNIIFKTMFYAIKKKQPLLLKVVNYYMQRETYK